MALKLYNTLGRRLEEFAPLRPPVVSVYTCGPTVYDQAHIGNLRSFLMPDILKRVLQALGYEVRHVLNITDVDDKTIKASRAAGQSLEQFTRRLEEQFWRDFAALNLWKPETSPRATDSLPAITDLIKKLIATGLAYEAEDGIYFKVSASRNYGRLALLPNLSSESRARVNNDEYDKAAPQDFALWKKHRPEDGETAWESPWGRGRPGWHIECSAMIAQHLGASIDIHTGGADLIFPHHTNEIAQSEGLAGQALANFWLHNEFVSVAGEKMSKSLGNTLTLADLQAKNIAPLAYRYWLLTAHYRTPVNFTWEAAGGAQNAWERLRAGIPQASGGAIVTKWWREFLAPLLDDLNSAEALAVVWKLIKDESITPADKRATLLAFDKILGLDLDAPIKQIEVPSEIEELLTARAAARQTGDFALADTLRRQIESAGFTVSDTPTGPQLGRI